MRILVVEDEEKVATFLRRGLEESAFTVDMAGTAEEALGLTAAATYDAIVLDLMLPGMGGLEFVREIRARGLTTAVMALTARGTLADRVAGLDAGCDDYLPKPFAFEELLARLRALLRRAQPDRTPVLEYGGLRLDPSTRAVSRDGRAIELTNKEYALLELLLRRPNQVFTRTTIMERIWGYDFDTESNILEVYINFLRKKIDRSHVRKLLHTVRGVGYVLREEEE